MKIRLLSIACLLTITVWAQENNLDVFKYRNLGPNRGGRSTTVTGVDQKPGVFYMGTTGGGLWKTQNYGNSWNPVSDGYFATGSIGAVRVASDNPDLVYVGTGSDGIRSNVIAGKGVYKSTNGGKSWEHVGLDNTGHIGAVEIHPNNSNVVYVAAIGDAFTANEERGLFRTQDGGKNWEKVLYINDSIGITDFEFAPDNPDIMYASAWQVNRKPWTIKSGPVGGVYKSTDGGNTWKQLGGGLPTGKVGKSDLAVSPANPDVLYVLIEALPGGGLYRSNDKGETFTLMTDYAPLLDRPFYYCNVDVNPQNENTVFVNATGFWRSFDGGKNFRRQRTPHGDNHDMWFHPSDTSLYIQCNDGGANVTLDYGRSWSTQENQSTAELYQVEVDDQEPYWLYAGQQDNSTIAIPNAPPYNSPGGETAFWMAVGGCETGPAVPKPGNPDIVYSNCKGRFGVYNKKTGQEKQYYVGASNMYGHNPKELKYRFQRVAPIHVSPHNPDVVYHGSQFLHKTTDDGETWETISPDLTAFDPATQVISGSPITRDVTGEEFHSTLYSIRESIIEEGIIWTGANDGPIHVTSNGGKTWNNVTPENVQGGGRVDAVEPSPHSTDVAYAAILRYQLGDWKPYVVKTADRGTSWTLLTDGKNGIPADYPVRVVREHPDKKGVLVAGTEYGLFMSDDDGAHWVSIQQNLPITPITDLKFYRGDLLISTMGRGFWVMDNFEQYVTAATEEMTAATLLLQDTKIAVRYRGGGNATPQYAPSGLEVTYYLPTDSEITLTIKDQDGQVVNRFESSKKSNEEQPSVSMATGFLVGGSNQNLPSKPGFNRFQWDMSHVGAWHPNPSRSGARGPRVAPGNFIIELETGSNEKINGQISIQADPRVLENGTSIDDLKAQEELALNVRDLLSEARAMGSYIEKMLNDKDAKLRKKKRQNLELLDAELNTAEGRYMTPVLIDQISYLASMISRSDQKPGKDAYDRYEELVNWNNRIKENFEKELGKLSEVLEDM